MQAARIAPRIAAAILPLNVFFWGAVAFTQFQSASPASHELPSQQGGLRTSPIVLSIDDVLGFSSTERAVFVTGHIACLQGSNFSIRVQVLQKSSSGPVPTTFASGPGLAQAFTVATPPRTPPGVAQGSTGPHACVEGGTFWNVSAFFKGSSSFKAGPAQVCAVAHLSGGRPGPRSQQTCEGVELVGN